MPKYRVKAHVSVIAQAEIEVDAATPEGAKAIAQGLFDRANYPSTLRRDCVVANSTDDSHPFDFHPLEAEQIG